MKKKSIAGIGYQSMMRKAALKATQIPTPWGPIKFGGGILLTLEGKAIPLSQVPHSYQLREGDMILIRDTKIKE